MSNYTSSTELEDHINVDITSISDVGKKLSYLTTHTVLDSALGFRYTSFKAVDKYLKIMTVDLELFRELVAADKDVAVERYRVYVANSGVTKKTHHHRSVMLFLMWERSKKDVSYYNAVMQYAEYVKSLKPVSYNANHNSRTRYGHWVLPLLTELTNTLAEDRVPLFDSFANPASTEPWHTVEGYTNNIDDDINAIHSLPKMEETWHIPEPDLLKN